MERKSYYCEKLETSLNFQPDYIKYCCSCYISPGIKTDNTQKINKELLLKERKKFVDMMEQGIIPEECGDCSYCKEKRPASRFEKLFKKNKLVNSIFVNHFKRCDCNCIYCSQKLIYKEEVGQYQLLPLIKDLYGKKLVDKKNLNVEFQGGNVSVLKEFDELISFFAKNNCKSFTIVINGIKYLPVLEKIAQNSEILIILSLDSGTRETFKKIKQVDKFDDVLKNIKKYEIIPNVKICLKYIIINNVNDNIEELQKFLNIANEVKNLVYITFDIDFRDIIMNHGNKFTVPRHYYDMMNFAFEYGKQNNLCVGINPNSKVVFDKGWTVCL